MYTDGVPLVGLFTLVFLSFPLIDTVADLSFIRRIACRYDIDVRPTATDGVVWSVSELSMGWVDP